MPERLDKIRVPTEEKVWGETFLTAELRARDVTRPKSIRLDMRRREVLRLRREPKADGSTRKMWEIRDIIVNTPGLVAEGRSYGINDVSNDLLVCLQTISDEVKEIAKEYIPIELRKLEKTEESVWDAMGKAQQMLDTIDVGDPDEIHANARTMQRIMDMVDKGTKSLDRIMARRAKYLPIETPKESRVDHRVMKFTLDDYLAAKQAAEDSVEESVIEGEFEASE